MSRSVYKAPTFTTKDSGAREEYDTGMVRDTQEGKPRFDLITPLEVPFEHQMLTRWAMLMARGAEKYGDRNWEKARTIVERARGRASAFRHFMQWFLGMKDEDHAAAVFFNITEVEKIDYHLEVQNGSSDHAGDRDQDQGAGQAGSEDHPYGLKSGGSEGPGREHPEGRACACVTKGVGGCVC